MDMLSLIGMFRIFNIRNKERTSFFFFNIYLLMRDTEREAERQAEGEAGSSQGTQCGTRSQVFRIILWAKGGTKLLSHPGAPIHPFHICLESLPNQSCFQPQWKLINYKKRRFSKQHMLITGQRNQKSVRLTSRFPQLSENYETFFFFSILFLFFWPLMTLLSAFTSSSKNYLSTLIHCCSHRDFMIYGSKIESREFIPSNLHSYKISYKRLLFLLV